MHLIHRAACLALSLTVLTVGQLCAQPVEQSLASGVPLPLVSGGDGKPHSAVGVEVTGNYVRAGVAAAYPHPNQFFLTPLRRGQPVYVNCDILLGGFGGEGYRNYIITPSTPHHDRMWQVVAETIQIMVDETNPVAVCGEIAQTVHAHQIRAGMQEFIYHRPGYGQRTNFEGHQPPFIALGDDTVVQEGRPSRWNRGSTTPRAASASTRVIDCS